MLVIYQESLHDAPSTKCKIIPYLYVQYNRLPEEEQSGSKHVEDVVKWKY